MAPRRRTDRTLGWLPPRVYRLPSGSYRYIAPDGASKVIARANATPGAVWAAYDRITQESSPNRLQFLWDHFQLSDQWKALAKDSQADYTQSSKLPLRWAAEVDCTAIRPQDIRKYMDARTAKTRANRELSWFKVVFAWAYERGLMPDNPAANVKPNKERRRTHIPTKDDYGAMMKISPPVIRAAMEIAYCTGLRQFDVLDLKWNQVRESGVLVEQHKAGYALDKELSERLRAALDLARTLPIAKGVSSVYVIHNRAGARYTRDGFQAQWQRYQKRIANRFTFHDIRRLAITDAGGDKRFSGHKTDAMAARYNVRPLKSPSH